MAPYILAFIGAPGPLEMLILLIFIFPVMILPAIAFWKICEKAGFPGVLGLLILVPFVNYFLPLFLAFVDWPSLRRGNGQADGNSPFQPR